ncbi:hypothetical protein [Qipengyuania flava]|uniref:hypothetical protein n=1 Tax=Qipengyuania flava TaxID=192812 RepID=UPI0021E5F060|nr:hypothetical protein [Qipengyuania flava]
MFDPVQGCLGNAQRGLRFCNPRSRPLDLLRPAARFESGERCGALAGTRFGKRDLVLVILRFKRGQKIATFNPISLIDRQSVDPAWNLERQIDLTNIDISIEYQMTFSLMPIRLHQPDCRCRSG